jgi:hypothetical protein
MAKQNPTPVRRNMKDQNEVQIALEIWNLTNKLGDLLWDRYDKEFLDIYRKEEEDQFLRTLQDPNLPGPQDKTEG